MPVKTKRWNDPVEQDDGARILICRYRPRGFRKDKETWKEWRKDLAQVENFTPRFTVSTVHPLRGKNTSPSTSKK